MVFSVSGRRREHGCHSGCAFVRNRGILFDSGYYKKRKLLQNISDSGVSKQQGKREHEDWRKPVFQKRNSNEAGNGSNFGRSGDEERYRREEISKDYRSSTLW